MKHLVETKPVKTLFKYEMHWRYEGMVILSVLLMVLFSGSHSLWAASSLGKGYEFAGNGKRPGKEQKEVWRQAPDDGKASLPVSEEAKKAAVSNLKPASGAGKTKVVCGNLTITAERFQRTAQRLADGLARGEDLSAMGLRRYLCRGEDGQGNVHFTGYFTPRLKAAKQPDGRFRYPLYQLPVFANGKGPTRQEIDQDNALASQSLELAWTDDQLDVYFLQVQGSGQLLYPDGTLERVRFAGGNGHPYKSLGQHLVKRGSIAPEAISLRSIRKWFALHPEELPSLLYINPSYTFFSKTQEQTRGSADVDLVAGCSVAADTKFFPLGSCLLAEVPRLDQNGSFQGYDLRLLFVHDTGGAIKGTGHLDLYHGVGREVGERAGDLHHYGRVWLLLAD